MLRWLSWFAVTAAASAWPFAAMAQSSYGDRARDWRWVIALAILLLIVVGIGMRAANISRRSKNKLGQGADIVISQEIDTKFVGLSRSGRLIILGKGLSEEQYPIEEIARAELLVNDAVVAVATSGPWTSIGDDLEAVARGGRTAVGWVLSRSGHVPGSIKRVSLVLVIPNWEPAPYQTIFFTSLNESGTERAMLTSDPNIARAGMFFAKLLLAMNAVAAKTPPEVDARPPST